jgi:hypothetical protein
MIPTGMLGSPGQTYNSPTGPPADPNSANNPLSMAMANQYALAQGKQQGQFGVQQAQIGAQAQEQGNTQQYQLGLGKLGQSQQGINALLGQLGTANSGGGGGGGNYGYAPAPSSQVAGAPSPGGLAQPVSNQLLQANINQNNAQNWGQAQGQSRQATQALAGSGLGATSPLAKALQANYFGQALSANQQGANTAQNNAATLNAQQALGAYQSQNAAQASEYGSQVGAQASQYGSALDYQAALAQVQAQKQNAILAALSNFAG